ncbi:MAG: hypothetical protein HDS70_04880 [Bacteroidales bacterium]|nr:hypothetical protein [Bacteroidales bacterium]
MLTELIIGLLGGGVAVQLLQTLLTLRQSRRQISSAALGGEVTAMQEAIRTLQENLENSTRYYRGEIERLQAHIRQLETTLEALQ